MREYIGKTRRADNACKIAGSTLKDTALAQRAAGMTVRELAAWFTATYGYDVTERRWGQLFARWREQDAAREAHRTEIDQAGWVECTI